MDIISLMKVRRGMLSTIENLALAQFGFTTDEERVYIGGLNGNVKLPNFSDLNKISVDPKTFGAVGDGVTDDTVAIQDALDSLSQGGTVLFSEGNYLITEVSVPSNVKLLGSAGEKPVITVAGSNSGLLISGKSHIKIEGIKFTNNNAKVAGSKAIKLENSSYITIENCNLVNQEKAVNIYKCSYVRFVNVNMFDNATGVHSDYLGEGNTYMSFGVYFDGCVIRNNVTGCFLNNIADLFFDRCDITNNTGKGISLDESNVGTVYVNQVVLSETILDSNGDRGIRCQKRNFVKIMGCFISSGRTTNLSGASFVDCDDVLISTTNFKNNGKHGLEIVSTNKVLVSNCNFEDNENAGLNMDLDTNREILVSNSRFENSSGGIFTQQYGCVFNGGDGKVFISNSVGKANSVANILFNGVEDGMDISFSNSDFENVSGFPFWGFDSKYFEINSNRRIFSSAAQPASGSWKQGARAYSLSPTAGGSIGWVCVGDGAPGTWKAFGTISV